MMMLSLLSLLLWVLMKLAPLGVVVVSELILRQGE
jgi:hypothetical protein